MRPVAPGVGGGAIDQVVTGDVVKHQTGSDLTNVMGDIRGSGANEDRK